MPRPAAGKFLEQSCRLYRQRGSRHVHALRHLLDGGMPRRGSRVQHPTVLFLLKRPGAILKKGLEGIANVFHFARMCGLLLLSLTTLRAATTTNIDESLLPAAATNQIDFARDIKPIFDTSCIRCHGPLKPKSGF